MKSKVNLYSVSECQSEVRVSVTLENQKIIESYLFSTSNTYYVDKFTQWLHQNIHHSAAELDIVLNGSNNTIYSLYFELCKSHPKVSLADTSEVKSHHSISDELLVC